MIEVEIWSDFLCPFCYIGKRNFDKALEKFAARDKVSVVYKSFELDPSALKSQKRSVHEYLANKYGQSVEWAKKQNERVTQMAAQCGLNYNLDKVIPTNSFDAHRIAHLALKEGKQAQFEEIAFKANFEQGKDLADAATLKEIAVAAGLSQADVDRVLNSDEYAEDVRTDEDEAHEIGVSGVPFFVFNHKIGVSGAQPEDVFLEALSKA